MSDIKKYYYKHYMESDNVGKFEIAFNYAPLREDIEEVFGITLTDTELYSVFDVEQFMEEHGEEITKMFEKMIKK